MLHNDFIVETFLDIMTCQELYFYRQVSKWTYNYITMDKIYKKLNDLVDERLRNSKYDTLLMYLMHCDGASMEGALVVECIWGIKKETIIHIVIKTGYLQNYIEIKENMFKMIPANSYLQPIAYEDKPHYILDNMIHIRFQHYFLYPKMFRYYYMNNQLVINMTSICHKIITMNPDDNFFIDHNGLQEENIELTKKICNMYDIKLIDNLPVEEPRINQHTCDPIPEWYFQ